MPPMPAAICGTRAPTAKNFVATAMPNWPVAPSLAMIDQVISSFLASGGVALHAPRIGGRAAAFANTGGGSQASFRPIGAGFDHVAAAGQLVARSLGHAVLDHEHARTRGARPERDREMLGVPSR